MAGKLTAKRDPNKVYLIQDKTGKVSEHSERAARRIIGTQLQNQKDLNSGETKVRHHFTIRGVRVMEEEEIQLWFSKGCPVQMKFDRAAAAKLELEKSNQSLQDENARMMAELEELRKAAAENGKSSQPAPKRKRRTKAEIEADKGGAK